MIKREGVQGVVLVRREAQPNTEAESLMDKYSLMYMTHRV
jgi:hypothetical protein